MLKKSEHIFVFHGHLLRPKNKLSLRIGRKKRLGKAFYYFLDKAYGIPVFILSGYVVKHF
ncbi:Putative protein [Zobellia galactanivorans]|uniref:Uncharacterized protein n=1 Tax=Zobellia galactanivorans (strain DSM 12802 / CCUG 47099 / CIP 106680 / NCIMB 13871 / Dsij) TaxID=63186 RepID=G0L2V4_ZOBGA|nr:hypothetical protein B4Q04_08280 [Zobellia sp. OII3]CAZ98219.1 Putative protein [Zobellia galactanivorans]